MSQNLYVAVLLLIAVTLGLRGSIRLTSRFRDATAGEGRLTNGERLLLGSLVAVAWFLTVVAVYLGVLSFRRLVGLEPLAFTAPITTVFAMVILLIPAGLDLVVERIAKGRGR